MTTFSATDAAFAGFRLMRERPRVILAWAVFLFLGSVASAAVTILAGAGQALADLQALRVSGNEDPAVLVEAMGALGPLFFLLLVLNVAVFSVVVAAANRAFLSPQDTSVGAFRFGADELRVLGLGLLMFSVWVVYLFSIVFVETLVFALAQAIGGPLAALIELVATVAAFGAVIYVWVRTSLALPMTLDQGRIVLFKSWGLTEGHFWRLLGAYLLTMVLLVVVGLLLLIVCAGVLALAVAIMGAEMKDLPLMVQPGLTSLKAYFSAGALLTVLLNAVVSAALLAIWAGPPAEAYIEITRGQRGQTFD